jgi:hypothetical protein
MELSYATVYQLAALGDAAAIDVRAKLRSEPGLIPYIEGGRMRVKDPVRVPMVFVGQLASGTAFCAYVLGTFFHTLLTCF